MKAILALEDGSIFHGTGFGAKTSACGEVCFNTSMTGYQEILTDPSYKGQIVTMTYPLIGNYGVNEVDIESWRPHAAGFVVRELSPIVSNCARIIRWLNIWKRTAFPAFRALTPVRSPKNYGCAAR
ncbi:MAG TPA: carbamoyl-phosphate synthase domain-containing protein [Candidatus Binatia bacterium]|nr:carbamoyl-phosphate synthase domain-containing protein [Candidatus Binatia bacterium]